MEKKNVHNIEAFLLEFCQHLELWQNGGQLLGKSVTILAALEAEKQNVRSRVASKDKTKTKM